MPKLNLWLVDENSLMNENRILFGDDVSHDVDDYMIYISVRVIYFMSYKSSKLNDKVSDV